MSLVGDPTATVVQAALRGLALRSDVRAHNVANVNTPGFQAQRVDFESALSAALGAGDPLTAAPAVLPDPRLPNANNNTVNLESELIGMMTDNLTRDALVNALNHRVSALRTAIGGR